MSGSQHFWLTKHHNLTYYTNKPSEMMWHVYKLSKRVGWETVRLFCCNHEPVEWMYVHVVTFCVAVCVLGQFKLPLPTQGGGSQLLQTNKWACWSARPSPGPHRHWHKTPTLTQVFFNQHFWGDLLFSRTWKHALSLSCLQQWRQIGWHWRNSKPPSYLRLTLPKNLEWIQKPSEQNACSHSW